MSKSYWFPKATPRLPLPGADLEYCSALFSDEGEGETQQGHKY